MNLYNQLHTTVLKELLSKHTRKFIKVLLKGEQYKGEYEKCKRSLEMIQQQFLWQEKLSNYKSSSAG